MPDEPAGQEPTQPENEGQPQEGTEGQPPQQQQQQSLTPEQWEAEARKARAEAARYRNELRQAQGRVQEYEQAQMSEQERMQQRLQELESQLQAERDRGRQVVLQAEVVSEASRLGFHNPRAAYKLLDQDAVEFDAEGKPQNLGDLLQDLLRAEPYLGRGAGSADGGTGRQQTETPDLNTQIRRMAGRG